MQFNVAGLLKDRIGATRSYEVDEQSLVSGQDTFQAVRGPVHMLRTDRGILVRAEISGITSESCSRCLAPATIDASSTVEEEFVPVNSFGNLLYPVAGESEGPADQDEFYIDDRNILTLAEAARQALVSALPMAPLCKPDCLGICPECAADRNVNPCSCAEQPRSEWHELVELKLR